MKREGEIGETEREEKKGEICGDKREGERGEKERERREKDDTHLSQKAHRHRHIIL